MKKIITLLLTAVLFISALPASEVLSSAEVGGNVVFLESSDFSISAVVNCSVSGNVITAAQQYPCFRIDLNHAYAIESIKLTMTIGNSDYDYRINPDTLIFMCDGVKTGATFGGYYNTSFKADSKSSVSFTVPSEYKASAVNQLYIAGGFVGAVSSGASITVESIEIIGKQLTQTITLTGDDFSLHSRYNCSVNGNVISSTTNQYPAFYLDLNKDYYIRRIKISATAAGTGYSTGENAVSLSKDYGNIVSLPWYYSVWADGVTSVKSADISAENQLKPINRINFSGFWSKAPTAVGAATLTVESVELTYWKNPKQELSFSESEISLSAISDTDVNGLVVTALNIWPKFLLSFSNSYCVDSVDITIENNYDYMLAWHSTMPNSLDLIFDDGTVASAEVTSTGSYWRGSISANSVGTLNITIPEDYKGKRLSAIEMEGYFPSQEASVGGNGNITVLEVSMNGVLDDLALEIIDKYNSVITYVDGREMYENAFALYKEAVSAFLKEAYYEPSLNSSEVIEDIYSYYNGKLIFKATVPNTDQMDYISEFGIVCVPSEILGDKELTIEMPGAQTVSVGCSGNVDMSQYSELLIPFVGTSDYAGNEITARAFVKYSDGINEVIYYSTNTNEEHSVINGQITTLLPASFDEPEGMVGDVNSDLKIDILDMICLKKALSATEIKFDFTGGDTNADGIINSLDLSVIREYLLGAMELPSEPYHDEFTVNGTFGV